MSAPQMFERKNKRMHTLWQPSHTKTEDDSKEVQHQYTQHTVKLFLRAPLHIKSSVYTTVVANQFGQLTNIAYILG